MHQWMAVQQNMSKNQNDEVKLQHFQPQNHIQPILNHSKWTVMEVQKFNLMEDDHIQSHDKLLGYEKLSKAPHCWNNIIVEEHSPTMQAKNQMNLNDVSQMASLSDLRGDSSIGVSLCLSPGNGSAFISDNRTASECETANCGQSAMENLVNSFIHNGAVDSSETVSAGSSDIQPTISLHTEGHLASHKETVPSQKETETEVGTAVSATSLPAVTSQSAEPPSTTEPPRSVHNVGRTTPPTTKGAPLEVSLPRPDQPSEVAGLTGGGGTGRRRPSPPSAPDSSAHDGPPEHRRSPGPASATDGDGEGDLDVAGLSAGRRTLHTADEVTQKLITSPPDLLSGQGRSRHVTPGSSGTPAAVHRLASDPPDPDPDTTPPPGQLLLTVRRLRMKLQREMETKTVLQQEVSGLKRKAEQKGGRISPGRPASDQPERARAASGSAGCSPAIVPPPSPSPSQSSRPGSGQPSPSAAADRTPPPPVHTPDSPGPSPAPPNGNTPNHRQLQRLAQDVGRLTDERDGAAAQVTQLQREAKAAREEREKLRRELHEARAELAALGGEQQRRQSEARQREAQLARAREETDALRAERESLRSELAARDARIAGLLRGLPAATEDRPAGTGRPGTETDTAGPPTAQWSWAEDAGWPAGEQTASEALRLGGHQMTSQTEEGVTSQKEGEEGVASQDIPLPAEAARPDTELSESSAGTTQSDVNATHPSRTEQQELGEKDEKDASSETAVAKSAAARHSDPFSDDEDDDPEAARHDTTPRAALWSRSGGCQRRRHPLRRHVHRHIPLQHIPEQDEPSSDWETDTSDTSSGNSDSGGSDDSRESHRSGGRSHSTQSGGGGGHHSQETVARLAAERDAAAERAAELDEAVTRLDVELTAVFVECETERRRAAEAGRRAETLEQERAAAQEQRQSAEVAAAGLRAELETARADRRGLADRLRAVTAENGELLWQLETERRELTRLAELRRTVEAAPTEPDPPAAAGEQPDGPDGRRRSGSAGGDTDRAQLCARVVGTPRRPTLPSQSHSELDADSHLPVFALFSTSEESQERSAGVAEALFSQVITGGTAAKTDLSGRSSPSLEAASPDCRSEVSQPDGGDGGTCQLAECLPLPAAPACASSATCDSGVDMLDQELDQTDPTDACQAGGGRRLSAGLGLLTALPPAGRRRLLLSDHEPPPSPELDSESLSCPDLSVGGADVPGSPSEERLSLDTSGSVREEIRRHLRAAVAAAGEPIPLSVFSPPPLAAILSPGSEAGSEPSAAAAAGRRPSGTPESASQRIARYTELEARRLVDEGERLRREVDDLRRGLLAERGWVAERELLAVQRENAALQDRLEELAAAAGGDRPAAAEAAQDECRLLRTRVAELEALQTENEALLARLATQDTSQHNTDVTQTEGAECDIAPEDSTSTITTHRSISHTYEQKQISGPQFADPPSCKQQPDSNERLPVPVETPSPDDPPELLRRVQAAEEARVAAAAELEAAQTELAETRVQLQQWVEYCHYWLGGYQQQPAAAEGQGCPPAPGSGADTVTESSRPADGTVTEQSEELARDSGITSVVSGAHPLEGQSAGPHPPSGAAGEGQAVESLSPPSVAVEEGQTAGPHPLSGAVEEGQTAVSVGEGQMAMAAGEGQTAGPHPLSGAAVEGQTAGLLPPPAAVSPAAGAPGAVQLCRLFGPPQLPQLPAGDQPPPPPPPLAGQSQQSSPEHTGDLSSDWTVADKLLAADQIQLTGRPETDVAAPTDQPTALHWPTVASLHLFGDPADDLL